MQDIVTRGHVGMPERITGISERIGKGVYRRIQTHSVKDIDKSQVHIDVVIKAGRMVIVVLDAVLFPSNRDVAINGGGVLELGRSAVGAADDLTRPSTLYLVHKDILGEGDLRRDLGGLFRR